MTDPDGLVACPIPCADSTRVDTAAKQLLDAQTYSHLAELFRALGDATRAKIVTCLLQQELCTCDLAVITGISESAVSQHLRILRALRLVKSRRQGKLVFHTLEDAHIALLVQVGISHLRDADTEHPAMTQMLSYFTEGSDADVQHP